MAILACFARMAMAAEAYRGEGTERAERAEVEAESSIGGVYFHGIANRNIGVDWTGRNDRFAFPCLYPNRTGHMKIIFQVS